MKRTFLRILPLAVAVLLATSCSKDENNDNNVVNNGQETVVTKEKSVSVSGTIDKKTSISKLSCANGVNITFDGGETIKFSGEDGKIHGSTTVASDGSFTVDLYYPADKDLSYLNKKSLTATIGTAPTNATGSYDDIDAAVADIYETGTTTIKVEILPSWDHTTNYSVSLEPLTINVEVAFVKNEKAEAINVSVNEGEAVSLAAGKICIVPAGVKVTADGKTKNTTVAGQVYTIEGVILTINGAPTETKYWGNDAFTLTASVEPSGVTIPDVSWYVIQGSADLTPSGDNNSSCSVLITGNTEDIKIRAIVDELVSEVTIVVDKDYVDLGTGDVYWKTSDESGEYTFAQAQLMNTPSKGVFEKLLEENVCTRPDGAKNTFINKNGSGASITLTDARWYWSSTDDGNKWDAWAVQVYGSGFTKVESRDQTSEGHVRLVRAQ